MSNPIVPPGVMIYFEISQPVQNLADEERGQLLTAILDYGEKGIIPDFSGSLAVAWGFIRPRIDRDAATYRETVLNNRYAVFCRDLKKQACPRYRASSGKK